MALKTFKPYTKTTRGTVIVDKSNLWKGSSYKPLTKGQHVTGGRNNAGRITSRHMGGGSKHKFRIIDFFRKKDLFFKIFIASLPIMFFGFFLVQTNFIEKLRNIEVIGWAKLIFGILLYVSDRYKLEKTIFF